MHFYTCSNYLISKCTMHVVHWLTYSIFYASFIQIDPIRMYFTYRPQAFRLFCNACTHKKGTQFVFCKVVLHTVIQQRCFALPPIDMVTLSDFPFTSSHHVYSVSTFIITYIILNLYFCNNKFTVNRLIPSMKQLLLLHKSQAIIPSN